jgi:hypothetical protein
VKTHSGGGRFEILIVLVRNFDGITRLTRFLSLAGCRVSSLAPPGSTLSGSSFMSENVPGAYDADDALERLRRILEHRRFDWVIFGDDIVLDRAVQRRDEPWLGRLLPLRGSGDAAEALISKAAFSRAMAAAGVPMAAARAASGGAAIRAAALSLGFPVVVKPDRGFAGMGLFSARSSAELEKGLESARGDYLVESMIDGRVGATPVLFIDGRPSWWSSFLKVGVFPRPFGPSCRRLPFEPGGLEPILERMGAALGLHGLFGVDWMLTPEGELFVLELNGRPIPMAWSNPHTSEVLSAALGDYLSGAFSLRRPPAVLDARPLHAMPASFSLAVAEGRWRQAAGLLLGLSGRTDTPWEDYGLLRKHAVRMAKTVMRTFYEGLPSPLLRRMRPAASKAAGMWRRWKYPASPATR